MTRSPIPHEERSPLSTLLAGVTAITATFVYFLLFAQFAFLDFAGDVFAGQPTQLQFLTGVLGVGGVVGSVLAARTFVPAKGNRFLMAGFAGCLVAALVTYATRNSTVLFFLGALVGLSMGWTTVALSLCLRPTLHHARLGAWCGLGTGLAYAICNQVLVFQTTNAQEATLEKIGVAAIASGIGLFAASKVRGGPARASSTPDYDFRAAAGWIAVFLVLVFLDTLAFHVIQNTAALKKHTWETPLILQGYAFVHICVAFITGLAIDQRWTAVATLVALLLMTASCVVLGFPGDKLPQARMLYVAAISIYSTILIYLPGRGGHPRFAAALFAISGWIGSGLALGWAMRFNFHRVSLGLLFIALLIGLGGLFTRLLWVKRVQSARGARP